MLLLVNEPFRVTTNKGVFDLYYCPKHYYLHSARVFVASCSACATGLRPVEGGVR